MLKSFSCIAIKAQEVPNCPQNWNGWSCSSQQERPRWLGCHCPSNSYRP